MIWNDNVTDRPAGGRAVDLRMLSIVNSIGYVLVIASFVTLLSWVFEVYVSPSEAGSIFSLVVFVFGAFALTVLVFVHLGTIADYYRISVGGLCNWMKSNK